MENIDKAIEGKITFDEAITEILKSIPERPVEDILKISEKIIDMGPFSEAYHNIVERELLTILFYMAAQEYKEGENGVEQLLKATSKFMQNNYEAEIEAKDIKTIYMAFSALNRNTKTSAVCTVTLLLYKMKGTLC